MPETVGIGANELPNGAATGSPEATKPEVEPLTGPGAPDFCGFHVGTVPGTNACTITSLLGGAACT